MGWGKLYYTKCKHRNERSGHFPRLSPVFLRGEPVNEAEREEVLRSVAITRFLRKVKSNFR